MKTDGGLLHFPINRSDAMNEHSPPFTDAEMDTARQTDLPDLLSSFGYQVKPKGNYHTLAEMPHIIIKRRSSYYDNYARAWGDAITFLETHHNMDFKQAVHYLLEHNGHSREQPIPMPPRVPPPPQKTKSPAEFTLPEAHTDHRRVFAYLIKRGISRDVIADFIRKGLLYESADHHNAVFVGKNAEGKPANAYKRGTYDQNGNGFKGDVPGGDKNNAFRLPADPAKDTVFCFESPIDLMAHISIYSEPKTNAVALCYLHDGTLEQYLKENPQIKGIVFCLDYDQWGREATERFSAKYSERGYTISALYPPKGKDWAEYTAKKKLCQSKGR
jgi:hypothetical protein